MARRGRPFKVAADLLQLAELVKNNDNDKAKSILIEHGIDAHDQNKRTAIISAAYYNNLELLKWLIDNRAFINAQDKNGESALHIAAQQCNLPLIQMLIKSGADINLQDCYGRNILMSMLLIGIDNPDIEVIEYLLKNNANPYSVNNYGICAYDVMNDEQRAITQSVIGKRATVKTADNMQVNNLVSNPKH
ncbi:MAG: ankyrin repeat domain-containing protein [Solitalea-like symbiont of Tyrophagus putrescentiae]